MTNVVNWLTVIASAIVATICGPVLSYVLLRRARHKDAVRIEELRADLDRETKRLDAERATLEAQLQTRYSWLYQARAEAMSEIYQLLLDAADAFEDFLRSWGTLPGDTKTPRDKWIAAYEAGDRFTKAFRPRRLLFPKAVGDLLDSANRQFVGIYHAYFIQLTIAQGDEQKAALKFFTSEKPQFSYPHDAINLIESEFRRLYGSDE